MRVDTDDYVGLTGRRPRGKEYGCWVFEILSQNGQSQGHITSKHYGYSNAAAEAKLLACARVGRKGKVVLCP